MIERRDFLRACIAGAGMVFVPKALDAFKWKKRESGVYTLGDPYYFFGDGVWRVGDPVLLDSSLNGNRRGIITRIDHRAPAITIQWL